MTVRFERNKNAIARSWRACVAAFASALFISLPSFATESGSAEVPGGGVVQFKGATSTNLVDGELVLVYDDTSSSEMWFKLPGTTSARILAVGGGGGGGGAMRSNASTSPKYGGGGGGGAGGFVETNGLFGAATYTVKVGAGGKGGDSATKIDSVTRGQAGGESFVLKDGAPWISALGGGGGGAVGVENGRGGSGGSGGGGSQYSADGKTSPVKGAGGDGASGKGNNGGDGDKDLLGGGGGGAGGAGQSANYGGAGGAGVTNNITGSFLYYAAGGGGGNRSGTAGAGGTGGGGAGGSGMSAAGKATTYGSGGGGGAMQSGGDGTNGVVIVRIAASISGGLERPVNRNFTFDGSEHTAIPTNAFYKTITGVNTATEVGIYMATVSLADGVAWEDGERDDVSVIMTISPKGSTNGVEYVTGVPIAYAGASEVIRVGTDLLLRFDVVGSFTLPGTSSARILAVGGGGGGGGAMRSIASTSPKYGGGGGGGAGGFVETNGLFGAATYTVKVGAGGKGGSSATAIATVTPGGAGGASMILKGTNSWIFAEGGGGGGAVGVENGRGGSGGSGGGGSQYSADGKTSPVTGAGGDGASGKGNNGGDGDKDLLGGGGGGAGGAGQSANYGGAGGAGVTNNITGSFLYYAAGGGGGNRSGTAGAGGTGGGGAGGSGPSAAGKATTYGSGGGGGAMQSGGDGTNGVVYVRISTAMEGEFTKPTDIEYEYDGNGHVSYVSNVFYNVEGQNTGTNAGVYVVTATLKSGGLWPNSDDGDPVTVSMTINPCNVTFSDPSISGWEYGSAPSVPTCSVSPVWVEPIYEYAASKDAGDWSATPPEPVGSYWVRVRARDDGNYSYEPKFAQFNISKVHVAFAELKQRDWMFGTPDDATPKPTCKVTPSWVEPKYEYEDDDGNWGDKKPTTIGPHHVRVVPPDFENYEFAGDAPAPAEFKIVKGLGNLFTDYVEILITYTAEGTDPHTLTNYPFAVTLAENDPPGFLYSRAGDTGNDLAFTDEGGEDTYQYYVKPSWNTNGVSTLYVRIPEIVSGETQKIRLYWHLRPDAEPPPHNPGSEWIAGIEDARAQTSHQPEQTVVTAVCRDGLFVNYWVKYPAMSKTVWDSADTVTGVITQEAKLAFGDVLKVITNIVTGTGYDVLPTNVGGSYRVIYTPMDPDEYEPISCHIDFAILGHNPYDDLGVEGEELTRSGRVLLVNDDKADGHSVSGQAYWRERTVDRGDGTILTNDLFWTHTGTFEDWTDVSNRLAGTSHRLFSIGPSGATNAIWRLEDVIIGNQLRTDPDIPSGFTSTLCSLPWSLTALDGTSYAAREKAMTASTSSYMMMRNKEGPGIYSPCYTNGIGTIYFDALNGFRRNDTYLPEYYRIVVEVATETEDGKAPTDENAAKPEATGVDGELGKLKWCVADMEPLLRDGGATSFTALPVTNDLALGVTTAQSTNNFYRVCVRVNKPGLVRFRIRRESYNKSRTRGFDGGDLILIDNIVVSPAPDTVELSPYGVPDLSRRGNIMLGQAAAMSVPFPAVNDSEVIPRAKAKVYANGVSDVDPATFASLARIHYQWKYLDQATNDWATADLSPSDAFTAQVPMTIPSESGDIRWWYEAFVQTPYYSYFDYSGMGAGLLGSGGKALYSEEVNSITNDNGGAGWYLRLRQGKSDWESFKVFVKRTPFGGEEQPEEPVDMEVVGDHLWRGYVRTPDASETLQVRFEGQNFQTPGDTEYATNRTHLSLADSVVKLPHASVLADLGEKRWISVTNNAATGYLMFQVDDKTYGISIVHADYQDFTGWTDAKKDVFVGTAWFTNELASGVSASAKEFSDDLSGWPASNAESQYWTEKFVGDYKKYEPFSSGTSLNGFTVGPGQYVYGYARYGASGTALQMEGRGVGFIQFVNAKEKPHGLESIRFNARLAQAIEFDDFSYFDGTFYGADKQGMTNYTFITKAAYDLESRMGFNGNGSLSLVAFYQPGEGCYEFRVEQDDADMNSGKWNGPGSHHRLTLHRWRYDDTSGEVVDTELSNGNVEVVDGGTGSSAMLTTDKATGKYALLFISVKKEATRTLISAGVSKNRFSAGETPDPKSVDARILQYIDTGDSRLQYGTYGVLAANCPGRFVYPGVTAPATTVATTTNLKPGADGKFSYPNSLSSCYTDINQGKWVVKKRRAERYLENATYYGFTTPSIVQPLEVYTAPLGTTDWELLATTNVATFKYFDEPIELKLWTLDDCAVKIAPGGDRKTARKDIVIDDIELRQWRGESYSDESGQRYFPEIRYGSPSNFVFTQAWNTTNEWGTYCSRLSARRSRATIPTSIRAPLMDGLDGRGIGLGMMRFTYENAQSNVNLLVQIATNNVSRPDLYDLTLALPGNTSWTTVTNFDFSVMSEEDRLSGMQTVYFGRHGVTGVVRIVLDSELVNAVTNSSNPKLFGEIDITGVAFRDEPNIDETSWWGWNVRTVDSDDMAYIGDRPVTKLHDGLSFALNNSVTNDIRIEDKQLYPKHLPFLQTPTFQDAEVGEVRFLARKYSASDAPTRVVLFGADSGSVADDSKWRWLHTFDVKSDRYAAYSYKVPPGQGYNAFRFAVTGVPNVDKPTMDDPDAPTSPYRILLDEVAVFEAVRSRIAFRNVAAFRKHLDTNRAISDIMESSEQPLCREQFGVQCEIFASQLANEIQDLSSAQVRLWWYESDEPWGFDNWKDKKTAAPGEPIVHSAWLAACEGTNLVFRSSHPAALAAVIDEQREPNTVQYMLEAIYETGGGVATDRLERADWVNPAWYHPVDLNEKNKGSGFSAYTILDTIAPGYAWINEANINDDIDIYRTSNYTNQYVEVAIPAEADIKNWQLRFITGGLGDDSMYYTNTVAVYGSGVPYAKSKNGSANYVFLTLGTSKSCTKATKAAGTIDGEWRVSDYNSGQEQLMSDGRIDPGFPIGVQLVRPSGIIEHSVIVAGTNVYADIPHYGEIFSASNFTAKLQKIDSNWIFAGEDTAQSPLKGLSATNQFALAGTWDYLTKTPGRINIGQYIDPDHPTPNGSSIILYANLEGEHINQSTGVYEAYTNNIVLYVPKGSESGTDIVYRAERWYEIDSITENGVVRPGYSGVGGDGSPVVFTTAVNASNNITVVAKARIETNLRDVYGLTADNAYTPAIMAWLSGGKTFKRDFENPAGPIQLAKTLNLKDEVTGELALTEMYWYDMDPTMGNLALKLGLTSCPTTHYVVSDDLTKTNANKRMSFLMMVTNLVDSSIEPYAPYTLRGVEPNSSSAENSSNWTSATFKVKGYLNNGRDKFKPEGTVWLPLQYYVFDENSFMPKGHVNADTGKVDEFQTYIEVEDTFNPPSPAYYQGWWKYPTSGVWFKVTVDSSLMPVGPSVLRANNYYDD